MCRSSSVLTKLDVNYNLIFAAETARAAGPMRDQFLDELGGVHVLPESSKGAGRMEVAIDERVAGRPLDEHGERAVAARSTAWLWVVGAAGIALAALFWVGFSQGE